MSDRCSVHGAKSPCVTCLRNDPNTLPGTLAALERGKAAEPAPDMVNAPPHYRALPCGVEPIDIVEHLPYNRGAAVKYLLRTGLKGGPEQEVEDLRKAAFYCTREADRVEAAQASS